MAEIDRQQEKKQEEQQQQSKKKKEDGFDKMGNEGMKAKREEFLKAAGTDVDESNQALKSAMAEYDKEKKEGNEEVSPKELLEQRGIEGREELITTFEGMMSKIDELEMMASLAPEERAVQVMEYLAESMNDKQLDALAVYDHSDLTKRMTVTVIAQRIGNELSPQALKLGGFAPVLYQLIFDAFDRSTLPMKKKKEEEEEEQQEFAPASVGSALQPLIGFLRLMGATA